MADGHHAGGDLDAGQTSTAVEGHTADARHAIADDNGRDFCAIAIIPRNIPRRIVRHGSCTENA